MSRFIFSVLKISLVLLLILGFGVFGAAYGAYRGYIENIEPITNDMLEIKILTSYIYDANGEEIATLTGSENMNRQLVYYNDISKHLPKAFIAIEDERFESHNGVDIRRIGSAAIGFVTSAGSAHGGSTITQQLIKNVTGNAQETLERKVQEWHLAMELEKKMDKWKILELYMNVIYFGHGCYGVQSASNTFFAKDVRDITLAEAALLASITNSPGRYDPYSEKGRINAMDRQRIVLSLMLKQGMIDQGEHDLAVAEKIRIVPKTVRETINKPQTYFVDQAILEVKNDLMAELGMTEQMALTTIYNYGIKIYTTQDSSIQAAMDEVFNDEQYFPNINSDAQQNDEQPQSAMVILDPDTAEIKAIYGGYGEKKGSNMFNRATQARRQPGSSFKPIAVYAPGIDSRAITAASVIDDAPVHLDTQNFSKMYPTNTADFYSGLTTVRTALRRSINVVAAKVWTQIPDTSMRYLSNLGLDRSDQDNVTLALGGLNKGVSPLEMAAAYAPFINKGLYYTPTTYTHVVDSDGKTILDNRSRPPTIVFSEQTSFIMTNMLQDVVSLGTGTYAQLFSGNMPAAGKTGTTNDNGDKWFVGYTPYYVGATWYGYDNRIKRIYLTEEEANQAMYIWKAVMEKVHQNLSPKDFPFPDGIISASVCVYSGKFPTDSCRSDPRGRAVRTEYFIKSTEPTEGDPCDVHITVDVCTVAQRSSEGTILANQYCPERSIGQITVIKRVIPFIPMRGDPYPADWRYEYNRSNVCSQHTAPRTYSSSRNRDGRPSGDGSDDSGNSSGSSSGSRSSSGGSGSSGGGSSGGEDGSLDNTNGDVGEGGTQGDGTGSGGSGIDGNDGTDGNNGSSDSGSSIDGTGDGGSNVGGSSSNEGGSSDDSTGSGGSGNDGSGGGSSGNDGAGNSNNGEESSGNGSSGGANSTNNNSEGGGQGQSDSSLSDAPAQDSGNSNSGGYSIERPDETGLRESSDSHIIHIPT